MEKFVCALKVMQDTTMYAGNVPLEAQLTVTKQPVCAPMPIKSLILLSFHAKIVKPILFLTPIKLHVFAILAML